MSWFDLAPAEAAVAVEGWVDARGAAAYRARQILPRLWQRPLPAWRDATDLPHSLIEALEREHPIPRPERAVVQRSKDGTVKYLWRFPDGAAVESVVIPEGRRRTVCISSQAGCAFGCVFCATGRMGFGRHLTPSEIALQVRELALDAEAGRPTNIVFMGMGEPLHNWRAVDVALSILNDPRGLGIGARHITVSTVGLLPGLRRLAARPEQFRLAISLHAARSDTRAGLMPVERRYPLPDLLRALAAFSRRVTLEYVMVDGCNDGDRDADALIEAARPLAALVNLLPLHPGGESGLAPTPPARIEAFAERLRAAGLGVTVRRSRGLDIAAACGQLRVALDDGRVGTQQHRHVQ